MKKAKPGINLIPLMQGAGGCLLARLRERIEERVKCGKNLFSVHF
jgi:hypothetical protein